MAVDSGHQGTSLSKTLVALVFGLLAATAVSSAFAAGGRGGAGVFGLAPGGAGGTSRSPAGVTGGDDGGAVGGGGGGGGVSFADGVGGAGRSEEHTSELQALMRSS